MAFDCFVLEFLEYVRHSEVQVRQCSAAGQAEVIAEGRHAMEPSDQPNHPHPPDEQIHRVYPDLAAILSDAECVIAGNRTSGLDNSILSLKSRGHLLSAIEWAIHLAVAKGLLIRTTVKKKQPTPINSHTVEAKLRSDEIPALSATDEFWKLWKAGNFASRQEEVILLVHGILTFAGWQPMVKRVLEEIPNTHVIPIKYGYFDLFSFWFPCFTRARPIEDLRRQIQSTRAAHPEARLSIVAHSFGTYAISQILLEHPDIQLHRLVLSGAIVPRTYRWDYVSSRLSEPVLNDYGTQDIYPVLAKCLSWGYGDTGRHGFGRGATVTDRGHDYAHSDFFNETFVRDYWRPWFDSGELIPSPWEEKAPPPSWFLGLLSVLPLQWIICGIFLTAVVWFGSKSMSLIPSHTVVPEPTRQNVPPTVPNDVQGIESDQHPTIVLPPFDFPSPEIAGIKPLTDTDRAKDSFADTKVVIRNETHKPIKLSFAYKPYQGRNPSIAASAYVQRESPEVSAGEAREYHEENFGGPMHVSIFIDGKWTATNEWFDLHVVPRRTLVVTEQDGTFNCRVEFEEE